jgi:endonuclease YncB( thermonuclease family)
MNLSRPLVQKIFVAIALIFFLPAIVCDWSGKVVGVTDGDTVKVL